MTTSDKEKREKDLQQAETYLNAGSEARKDGKLDQAADAFGSARRGTRGRTAFKSEARGTSKADSKRVVSGTLPRTIMIASVRMSGKV